MAVPNSYWKAVITCCHSTHTHKVGRSVGGWLVEVGWFGLVWLVGCKMYNDIVASKCEYQRKKGINVQL